MTTAFLTNWTYVAVFIAAGAAMVVGILLMSRLIYPIHPSPEKYSRTSAACGAGRATPGIRSPCQDAAETLTGEDGKPIRPAWPLLAARLIGRGQFSSILP